MTAKVKKALEYARTHMQGVRIALVNGESTIYGAEEAVELCSNPFYAARIVAAVPQDKKFEKMLNDLIDAD